MLLAGSTLAVYFPFLFAWLSCDEGIFAVMARGPLVTGTPLYLGHYENKPPVVFLLYGLVMYLFGPGLWKVRLLFAACVFLTAGLLTQWLRTLVGWRPALLAGLLYPLLSVVVVTGKAYTEIPLALFTTAAFYALWCGFRQPRGRWWTVAGVCLGLALASKQVAIFEIAVTAVVLGAGRRQLAGKAGRAALQVGAGLVAVWALIVAWLALTGQLAAFWFCLYTLMLAPHVAAEPGEVLDHFVRWWLPILLTTAPLWFGVGRGMRRGLPREDPQAGRLARLWLLAALVGAAASRQLWPHYALQFLPPLLLAGVLGLADLGAGAGRRRRRVVGALVGVLVVALAAGAFAQRHRYVTAVARITGREPNPMAQVGYWLGSQTSSHETIYCVGRNAQVYVYAQRQPASPHLWSFFVTDAATRASVLADLRSRRPAYIIVGNLLLPYERVFATQVEEELLARDYIPVTTPRFPGYEVYRRGG